MANVLFSIDGEGIAEVLSDLADALNDIGFNVVRERFDDPRSPLRHFISNIDSYEPVDAWNHLKKSLQELAKDVDGDPKAIKYIKVAYEDCERCCTFEQV